VGRHMLIHNRLMEKHVACKWIKSHEWGTRLCLLRSLHTFIRGQALAILFTLHMTIIGTIAAVSTVAIISFIAIALTSVLTLTITADFRVTTVPGVCPQLTVVFAGAIRSRLRSVAVILRTTGF